MKTEHFPSLELCRKLTGIGFPKTELGIFDTRKSWKKENCPYVNEYEDLKFVPFWNIEIGDGELEIDLSGNNPSAGYNNSLPLVYPSVMEMLDVIPPEIELTIIKKHWMFDIATMKDGKKLMNGCICYSLPDNIADRIIWLFENKYLTFPLGNSMKK